MILFLSAKYFLSKNFWKQKTLQLGVLGLSLGVGALILSMSIVSGFEKTLETSLIDSFGHLVISQKYWSSENSLKKAYKHLEDDLEASTPFILMDGVATHKGQISGVVLEGVSPQSVKHVLNLKKRFLKGHFSMDDYQEGVAWAFVGKDFFKKMKLTLGDVFSIVLFIAQGTEGEFKKIKLRVKGVLDLGRFDYNQRFIMTDLKVFQKALKKPFQVSGLRLKLKDPQKASEFKKNILFTQGLDYDILHYKQRYANLFEAVKIQKMTLFFVLLLMVCIAAFNISSTLYVNVVKKFSHISLLKSMGLTEKKIIFVFCLQGLFIGLIGSCLGVFLGFLAAYLFTKAQNIWSFLPSKTYHVSVLEVNFLFSDILLIVLSSLFICFLASYGPSLKGARHLIAKGLRYE